MFRFGTFAATAALAVGFLLPFDSLAQAPEKAALDLNQIISIALKQSPRLKGAEAGVAAADAGRGQASALPNPQLGLEAENLGGSGDYRGTRSAELTAGVSQLIEIGGKRSARIDIADSDASAARIDREVTKSELIRDLRRAYADVIAAREEVKLANEQQSLADDVLGTVNQRVGAAAEPVIQQNKARIARASAVIAAAKAKGAEQASLQNLAVLMGEELPPANLQDGDFYKLEAPAPVDMISLKQGADFQRSSAALDKAQAALSLEQATAIPDPTVSAGVRQFRDSDEKAFVVGVSIPLPVFNMNRGNIERARQEAVKADADRMIALQDGQTKLVEAQQNMQSAYLEATQYKDTVLPEADKAFAQARRGYGAGKFSYLEVLDAQRTLAETRLAYIAALKDYHFNKAEIERLTLAAAEIKEND